LQLRARLEEPATLSFAPRPIVAARAPGVELGLSRFADVPVLFAFVAFAFLTHAPYVVHGQPWVDAAMFFHFGHKLLTTGAVPFRDYVFQVGPLPIYVDALFQKLFGATYVSSLWAAVTLKACLAFVLHLFARRSVGRVAGVLLGVFVLLDPVFCFQHHWSTTYALLFALLAILSFARAHDAKDEPKKKGRALFVAGLFVAAIVTARQSGAVIALCALAVVSAALAVRCSDFMDRAALVRLWGGVGAGLAVFAFLLAAQGALGSTFQALILDAPAKKSVLNLDSALDALTGGGFAERAPPFSALTGVLYFNAVPFVLSIAILYGLWRKPRGDAGALLLAMLPIGVAIARVQVTWAIGALDDLPRVFGLTALTVVLVAPRTGERMLGIPAPVAAPMLALPLALEVALEASYFGRGWVDASSMIALALLVGLRTRRIGKGKKTLACATFALVGVVNTAWLVHRGFDPFAKDDMFEGTLADTRFSSDAPATRGMYMDETKLLVTSWLRARVHPGDTCFVYGTSSMLYDLLECTNPSGLDITISDFFSVKDGERTLNELRAAPPEWIVAAESHWTNPDLATPFTGDESIYWTGPNGAAAKTLHLGVQSLLEEYGYEVVGETKEALRPDLLPSAEAHPEKPHRFRLYHRGAAAMGQAAARSL
jgi:hypothetical protein